MEIRFDDLTDDAQKRLLREAGVSKPEEMHWDEVPVAVVEFQEDTQLRDSQDIKALEELGWEVITIWECQTYSQNRIRHILEFGLAQ